MMQLERLEISRRQWGDNAGKMEGEITFSNPASKIQLILTEEACHKMLKFCAESLVQSSQEVAKELTIESIVGEAKKLEHEGS